MMLSESTRIALTGMGSSKLRLDDVWEPSEEERSVGVSPLEILTSWERTSPVVIPLSDKCIKVEYNGPLDGAGCRAMFEAVKHGTGDNPKVRVLIVIEDPSHRTVREAWSLMNQLVPGDLQGRVAVVWISRLIDCEGMPMGPNVSNTETRLYGTSKYRHALDWLGVMY